MRPKQRLPLDRTGCTEPTAQREAHGAAHRQACHRHADRKQAVSRGVHGMSKQRCAESVRVEVCKVCYLPGEDHAAEAAAADGAHR